jgi:hypothetical protein
MEQRCNGSIQRRTEAPGEETRPIVTLSITNTLIKQFAMLGDPKIWNIKRVRKN